MEDVIKKIIGNKFFNFISFLLFFLLSIISNIYLYSLINDISFCDTNDNSEISLEKEETTEEVQETSYIYVDIKGYVENPGVYKLLEGSIVNDLIFQAGGLKKDANTRFINLSKRLNDGDAVVIYSNKEISDAKKSNQIVVETPCVCEEVKNDACVSENVNTDKININSASVDELMTLSGIGESKAKAIVDYRTNNGNFKSIDEIVNVSGISETLFAKIKDYITI